MESSSLRVKCGSGVASAGSRPQSMLSLPQLPADVRGGSRMTMRTSLQSGSLDQMDTSSERSRPACTSSSLQADAFYRFFSAGSSQYESASSVDWHKRYRTTLNLLGHRGGSSTGSVFSRIGSGSVFSADESEYNTFVIIIDRASGSGIVHYLLVDTASSRPHPVPRPHRLPMPQLQHLYAFRAVSLNNQLYVLGGRHEHSTSVLGHCYRYDPEEHSWTREASMLRGRVRFTATVLDGCIYVCGGELRDGRVTASVECYDPLTGCWGDVASMPLPRVDHAVCAVPGGLFLSGGASERKRGGSHAFWFYDAVCDEWTEAGGKAILPSIRENHIMITCNNTLYCVAGLTIKRAGIVRGPGKDRIRYREVESESCWRFPLDKSHVGTMLTGLWDHRDTPDIPSPRVHAGAVVIGPDIYVMGGQRAGNRGCVDDSDNAVPQVERYDSHNNRWCEAFILSDPDLTASHTSASPPPATSTPRSSSSSSSPFADVDAVLLRVPKTNLHFSHLDKVMSEKSWILW